MSYSQFFRAKPLLEVVMLDQNNLTGTMDDLCEGDRLGLVIADCGELDCACCNLCCFGNGFCNDNAAVASVDPSWELSYQRTSFRFSDSDGAIEFELIRNDGQ